MVFGDICFVNVIKVTGYFVYIMPYSVSNPLNYVRFLTYPGI